MRNKVLENKSFSFAIRIVRFCTYIRQEKKEFVLSKQILRSGTSIGANIAEATYAQSRADFFAKIGIAKKEAAETLYWLMLFGETGFITAEQLESMKSDCVEILKILALYLKRVRKKSLIIRNSYFIIMC